MTLEDLEQKSSPSHWPISILSSLSSLVNMFVPLVMVRMLHVDQVGHFKIFFLYIGMIPALSLAPGLVSGLAYWVGQGQKGQRTIQAANSLVLLSGLFWGAICLAASPWIASHFEWPLRYAFLFALSAWGAVGTNFFEESAIVKGKVWFAAAYLSGTEMLRSLAILLTAWISRSLDAILICASLFSVLKLMANIYFGGKLQVLTLDLNRERIREVFSYALPVSLAILFGVFLNSGDQFVLSHVMSPGEFAIYASGCLVVPPLLILEQSVTRVMIPQLSAAFAQNLPRRALTHYRDAVEQLAWLIIPSVTGLIVFSKPIITLLFTPAYAQGAFYLRWFALSYLLLIFPWDAVSRARGEGKWILKSFSAFAPLAIILCFLLGMNFGAIGALVGALVSRAALRLWSLVYVKRSTQWRFKDFVPYRELVGFTALSIALAGLCVSLKPVMGSGLKWFLGAGFIFSMLYLPLSVFLGNWIRRNRNLAEFRAGQPGRVLLFSQHLGIGGLERMVLSLGQTLRRNTQWQVFLFSHDSDENAESFSDRTLVGDFLRAGIPVEALKKGAGFSVTTLLKLAKNIFKNKIDVIHSHDLGTLVYAVLANFLTLGRVRIVHTQHSFVHVNYARRYALYERIFSRFVDTLTVVNPGMIEDYARLGLSSDQIARIQIITNGVAFSENPILNHKEKISHRQSLISSLSSTERLLVEPLAESHWILYLARFHSVKGQRDVAEIWKSLSLAFRKKATLLMVGPDAEPGERQRVLDSFKNIPDRDRVIFIDGTRTPQAWLAASDLFLSASRIEGMPLGPIEAVASGMPAVLSAISGHRFLEDVSLQFSVENATEGASMIERSLTTPDFGTEKYYATFWEQAETLRQRHSLTAMAESYFQLYLGNEKRV